MGWRVWIEALPADLFTKSRADRGTHNAAQRCHSVHIKHLKAQCTTCTCQRQRFPQPCHAMLEFEHISTMFRQAEIGSQLCACCAPQVQVSSERKPFNRVCKVFQTDEYLLCSCLIPANCYRYIFDVYCKSLSLPM